MGKESFYKENNHEKGVCVPSGFSASGTASGALYEWIRRPVSAS
ncbi:MAG: hypothetical protein ACOCSE_02110 [Chitinivibrionales bacterium]